MHGTKEVGVSDRLNITHCSFTFDHCSDAVANPVIVGSRVCVIPGRRFEGIALGDVGTILHLHDASGMCSVAFDCLDEPCQMPLCYLQTHAALGFVRPLGDMDHFHDGPPKSPYSAPLSSAPPTSPAESESHSSIAPSCLQSPCNEPPSKALTTTASGLFNPARHGNLSTSAWRTTRPPMVPPLPLPLEREEPEIENDDGLDEMHSFSMCSHQTRESPARSEMVDFAMGRNIPPHSSSAFAAGQDSAKYAEFTVQELEPRLQEFLRSFSEVVHQRFQDLDDRLQRFTQSRFDACGGSTLPGVTTREAMGKQWLDERLNAMYSMSQELETKIAAVTQHLDLIPSGGLRSEEFGDIDKRFCETESKIGGLVVQMETLNQKIENQEQSCSALQNLVDSLDRRVNLGIEFGQQALDEVAGITQSLTDVAGAVEGIKSDASNQRSVRAENRALCDQLEAQMQQVQARFQLAEERNPCGDTSTGSTPVDEFRVNHQKSSEQIQTQKSVCGLTQASNLQQTIAEDVAEQFQMALAEVRLDATLAEATHRQDRNLVLSRLRSELDDLHSLTSSPLSNTAKTQYLHSITSSPLSNAAKIQSPVSMVLRASSAPVRERPMHATCDSEGILSRPQAPVSEASSCASGHTYSVHEASSCASGRTYSVYEASGCSSRPTQVPGSDVHNSSHTNATLETIAHPIGPAVGQAPLRTPCSPVIATTAAANTATTTAMPSRSASMTCAMCGNMCMDVSELCRRCTVKTNRPGAALGMARKSSWAHISPKLSPSPCRSRLNTSAAEGSQEYREAHFLPSRLV